MKKLFSILSLVGVFAVVLMGAPAEAAETLKASSGKNQTFQVNQSSSILRTVLITEADDKAMITAESGIRITIPDEISIIFDSVRIVNELSLAGSALNSGKVQNKPEIKLEDKDKTVFIPVEKDFAPGETLEIINLSIKGFHERTTGSNYLQYDFGGDNKVFQDEYFLLINSSSIQDRIRPLVPTELSVDQVELNSVELKWMDPTDLDLSVIKVYKGKGTISPSFLIDVPAGQEAYTDSNVEVGESYTYQLIASDGRSFSDPSEISSIDVIENFDVVEPDPVDDSSTEEDMQNDQIEEDEEGQSEETSTVGEEPDTEEEVVEDEPVDLQMESKKIFDDVSGLTESELRSILYLSDNGIIKGRSDRQFVPAGTALRSEFAKMVVLSFAFEIGGNVNSFPDVDPEAWYAEYISTLLLNNVMLGSNGKALPSNKINRAEAVTMIVRAMGIEGEEVQFDVSYRDVRESDWFYKNIQLAQSRGLLDWVDNENRFYPGEFITRTELSMLIYAAVNQ